MNLLTRFRRDHAADEAMIADAISEALSQPITIQPERNLLETSSDHVAHILTRLRADEQKLEAIIAERTERLRQTRISIEAFSLAQGRLADG